MIWTREYVVAVIAGAPDTQAVAARLLDGERHSLAVLAGERATVLIFTSGSCPTARSYEDRLIACRPAGITRGSA